MRPELDSYDFYDDLSLWKIGVFSLFFYIPIAITQLYLLRILGDSELNTGNPKSHIGRIQILKRFVTGVFASRISTLLVLSLIMLVMVSTICSFLKKPDRTEMIASVLYSVVVGGALSGLVVQSMVGRKLLGVINGKSKRVGKSFRCAMSDFLIWVTFITANLGVMFSPNQFVISMSTFGAFSLAYLVIQAVFACGTAWILTAKPRFLSSASFVFAVSLSTIIGVCIYSGRVDGSDIQFKLDRYVVYMTCPFFIGLAHVVWVCLLKWNSPAESSASHGAELDTSRRPSPLGRYAKWSIFVPTICSVIYFGYWLLINFGLMDTEIRNITYLRTSEFQRLKIESAYSDEAVKWVRENVDSRDHVDIINALKSFGRLPSENVLEGLTKLSILQYLDTRDGISSEMRSRLGLNESEISAIPDLRIENWLAERRRPENDNDAYGNWSVPSDVNHTDKNEVISRFFQDASNDQVAYMMASVPWKESEFSLGHQFFAEHTDYLDAVHRAIDRPHLRIPILEGGYSDWDYFESSYRDLLAAEANYYLATGDLDSCLDSWRSLRRLVEHQCNAEFDLRQDSSNCSMVTYFADEIAWRVIKHSACNQEHENLILQSIQEPRKIMRAPDRNIVPWTLDNIRTTTPYKDDFVIPVSQELNWGIFSEMSDSDFIDWKAMEASSWDKFDRFLEVAKSTDNFTSNSNYFKQLNEEYRHLDEANSSLVSQVIRFALGPSVIAKSYFAPTEGWEFIFFVSFYRREVGRVALALEIFNRRSGAYPNELAELCPGVLPALPEDPYSGLPFRYHLKDEGFLLYSVGSDGVDDGGQDHGTDYIWVAPSKSLYEHLTNQ